MNLYGTSSYKFLSILSWYVICIPKSRRVNSQQAQVTLHFDELIGIVRLKCPLEIECLVAAIHHGLGLLVKHVRGAVSRGR